MDIDELRSKSNAKVLLRGQSGRGKTDTASKVTVELLQNGHRVCYVDTESEGATTIVSIIDENGLDEDIVEYLDYVQVNNYDSLMEVINNQEAYDCMVIDTLDHKHSYVLKDVTDAKIEADADWNEYYKIYSLEKELMEKIGKPKTNIIATIDPQSGKMDKPKGAQVNIHGYFNVVIDLTRTGDDWNNKIVNWVGKGDVIGNEAGNLVEALTGEIEQRIE